MNAWSRISSAGMLVAAMTIGGAVRAHAAAPQPDVRHLAVAVYDHVGVDPATLVAAERLASDVYLRAGIEIDWVEPDSLEDTGRFYINLLSKEMAAPLGVSKDTVGVATPGSVAASAIYDRIREVARDYRVPCGVLLGYVMAHELGHLLLPAHSHSPMGLMQASLDMQLAAAKKLRFTSDQAALMQARLTTSPVVVSTH